MYIYIRNGSRFLNIQLFNLFIEYRIGCKIIFVEIFPMFSVLMRWGHVKRDLYFRLPPLTARAPSQTDEAFILDAFAVVLFFETTGGDEE